MCQCKKQSCCSSSCECGCQSNNSCSSSECCDKGGCDDNKNCCEHAKKLLCVADMAWMEVLKEHIKEYIKQNDTKIAEIAKVVAEANHARWQEKMCKHNSCHSYEEKLKAVMDSCSSSECSTSNHSQGYNSGR